MWMTCNLGWAAIRQVVGFCWPSQDQEATTSRSTSIRLTISNMRKRASRGTRASLIHSKDRKSKVRFASAGSEAPKESIEGAKNNSMFCPPNGVMVTSVITSVCCNGLSFEDVC